MDHRDIDQQNYATKKNRTIGWETKGGPSHICNPCAKKTVVRRKVRKQWLRATEELTRNAGKFRKSYHYETIQQKLWLLPKHQEVQSLNWVRYAKLGTFREKVGWIFSTHCSTAGSGQIIRKFTAFGVKENNESAKEKKYTGTVKRCQCCCDHHVQPKQLL